MSVIFGRNWPMRIFTATTITSFKITGISIFSHANNQESKLFHNARPNDYKSIVFCLTSSNQLFVSINLIQRSVDLHVHAKTKWCYKSCYAKIKKQSFCRIGCLYHARNYARASSTLEVRTRWRGSD